MPNPVINHKLTCSRPVDVFPGPVPDFHLDASRITGVAAGGAVSNWQDISGHGRDFVQATGANQPTWQVSINNNKAAVLFGAGKFMTCATLVSTQNWTYFLVNRSPSSAIQFMFYHGDATNGYGFYVSTDRSIQCRNAGATVNSTDAAYVVNTPEVWATRRNNTGPLLELWLNGVAQTLSANPAQGLPGTSAVLGGFSGGTINWGGYLFECIGYSSLLTDSQRSLIEQYLKRKYNAS